MVPALKALVVGVPVMAVHNRRKPPPIDRFEQTSKGAIEVAHARSFLSLDNQKEPICIGSAEHAPRHSESFPGQPCARMGARAATSRPAFGMARGGGAFFSMSNRVRQNPVSSLGKWLSIWPTQ